MRQRWVAVVRGPDGRLLAVGDYDHDVRAQMAVRALLEAFPGVEQVHGAGDLGAARLVTPQEATAILSSRPR